MGWYSAVSMFDFLLISIGSVESDDTLKHLSLKIDSVCVHSGVSREKLLKSLTIDTIIDFRVRVGDVMTPQTSINVQHHCGTVSYCHR